MINSITIYKNTKNFTTGLYHLKNKDVTYNFSDGINIITGRNGSGKSVLLKLLAYNSGILDNNTCAVMPSPSDVHIFLEDDEEKAWTKMPELIKKNLYNKNYPKSDINWDGSIVHYLTPEHFNENNMWNRYMNESYKPTNVTELFNGAEILNSLMSSNSKGEKGINVLIKLFNLSTNYPLPLQNVNDMWLKASDLFQDWIKSLSKTGKPTLLIDELDSNLDLDNQSKYWEYINYLTNKWQVIVVSHSIFALRLKKTCKFDVNYINLNPEYFNKVNKLEL